MSFHGSFSSKNVFFSFFSFDDDVRSRQEDGNGRDDCEGRESDQAEAIDDHGSELPIPDDLLLFVVNLHPVGDELQLFEDALELAIRRGRAAVTMQRGVGRGRGKRLVGGGVVDHLPVQRVPVHANEPARTVRTS